MMVRQYRRSETSRGKSFVQTNWTATIIFAEIVKDPVSWRDSDGTIYSWTQLEDADLTWSLLTWPLSFSILIGTLVSWECELGLPIHLPVGTNFFQVHPVYSISSWSSSGPIGKPFELSNTDLWPDWTGLGKCFLTRWVHSCCRSNGSVSKVWILTGCRICFNLLS